jgi:hypothetical protein
MLTRKTFKLESYLTNVLDLKLWGFSFIAMISVGPAFAIALFLPIILDKDMGLNTAQVLCLTAPSTNRGSQRHHDNGILQRSLKDSVSVRAHQRLYGVDRLWSLGVYIYYRCMLLRRIPCCYCSRCQRPSQPEVAGKQCARAMETSVCIISQCFLCRYWGHHEPHSLPWPRCTALFSRCYFARSNRKADEGELIIEGLGGFRYTL